MPPAAVLRVLVQAAGIAETNRALMSVHATLERVQKRLMEFGQVRATAHADVDTKAATAAVAKATTEVRKFGALTAEARLAMKVSGAEAQIEQIRAKIDRLAAMEPTVEVRAQIAKALTDLERVEAKARDLARKSPTVTVDVDTRGARTQLSGVDRALAGTGKALTAIGDRARGGGNGLDAMRGSIGPLSGGLGGLSSIGLFLAVVLVGLIGPAFALAAALAPLAGLLAAAGAGAVAGAQGFGVFKLATMGVLDALKEQTKNQAAAGAGAIKHAGQEQSAARAIAAAQEGVKSAREGVADAARQQADAERQQLAAIAALPAAIVEARRTLNDMRASVDSTNLSLAQTAMDADDARQELADLLAGPSPRALADAHLAVSDALRNEATAARDLTRAQQALKDLMAPPAVLDVADAQDAVSDAMRQQQHAAMDLADQIAATNAVMASPGSSSDDRARAQLALADAQNAVGDAARRTEHAQASLAALQAPASADAVAEAQGRIADAQAAVTAATQGTADARAALATLEAGPTDLEIAKASLAVAEAENAVSDALTAAGRAATDYNAAQKAGLRGSDAVLAAHAAIRDATRARSDADRALTRSQRQLALAVQGVSDAQASAAQGMDAAGASAANLNTKFDSLPPSAQRFVRVLESMKGKVTELRTVAADGFFPGAEDGLRSAARNFEPLRRVVDATAKVLGHLAREAGALVGSSAFGKDIETVGMSNTRVLDSLGHAAIYLVSALRHVLVVVGPLTENLSNGAEAWAKNTDEAARAGRESGRMAAFFERTRVVLGQVLSIVGHVTHGLFGMGKASDQSGQSILASIDRVSKRFDAWANSTSGQESLKNFFRDTKELAAQLVPAIANMAKGFGVLTLKLLPVAAALKLLGPYADEAVIAFLSYKLALTAVNIAQGTYNVITATSIGRGIVWRALLLGAATATGIATAAQWLLNVAMTANPIGLIIVGIAALIAIFIALGGNLGDVGDAFTWLWGVIKDGATSVIGWLKTNWPTVLAILGGPIGLAVLLIVKNWNTIKNATTSVWTAILSFLTSIWNTIKSVAGTAWEAIKTVVMAPMYFVRDTISTVATGIANRLGSAWDTIKGAASSAWDSVRDFILTPVRAARDAIPDIVTGLGNRIGAGWDLIKKGATSFATGLKDTITDAFKGAANLVIGFVNKIIDVVNIIPGVPNIGKIDKLAAGGVLQDAAAGGAAGAVVGAGRFARGGAFGRTGGLVTGPITLMGEEAPRFPEYVIPTNPAYRGRAQMLLGQAAGAVGMADGGVFGAIKGAIGGAASAAGSLLGKGAGFLIGKLPGTGDLPDWLKGTGKYVLKHIGDWLKDKVGLGGGSSGPPGGGAPAGDVTDWLTKALNITGLFSTSNLAALYRRAMQESGGDPHAINLWDSNAAAGHPSKGLLQTIDGTFNQYKLPGHGDIWDPIDNAIAAIRYMLATYGHIVDASGTGYAMGGLYGSFADGTDYVPRTGPYLLHQGETVTPAGARSDTGRGGGNVIYNGTVNIGSQRAADVLNNRNAHRLRFG